MLKRIGEGVRPKDTRDPVMPPVLCLVRHGESYGQFVQRRYKEGDKSLYTEEFRHTPSSEWPLTQDGFAQTLRTGHWMDECLAGSNIMPNGTFDRAFYSPYTRARQSLGGLILGALRRQRPDLAAPNDLNAFLNEFNVAQIREDFRLDSDKYLAMPDLRARELDFGVVSTIPKPEFRDNYHAEYLARQDDPMYARLPSGESLADLHSRGRDIVGAVTRAYEGGAQSVLVVAHGRFMTMVDFVLRGINPESREHFEHAVSDVDNAEAIFLSRINPEDANDVRRSYHWRSSTVPWRTPHNEPPAWQEFEVKTTTTAGELLQGIPEDWLLLPPAGLQP